MRLNAVLRVSSIVKVVTPPIAISFGQQKAVHFLICHRLTQVGHGDDPGQVLLPVNNREILLVGGQA